MCRLLDHGISSLKPSSNKRNHYLLLTDCLPISVGVNQSEFPKCKGVISDRCNIPQEDITHNLEPKRLISIILLLLLDSFVKYNQSLKNRMSVVFSYYIFVFVIMEIGFNIIKQ